MDDLNPSQEVLAKIQELCRKLEETPRTEERKDLVTAYLREGELRYQSLYERVPIGLYETTPEGKWINVNSALVDMLGYPDKETLLEVNVSAMYVRPAEEKEWLKLIEKADVVREHEIQLYRYDGTPIWVLDSTRAVRDSTGELKRFEGGLQDITQQKQAEQALRDSERIYRNFFQTSQDGIFIITSEGEWLEMNQRAVELFGYPDSKALAEVSFPNLYVDPQSWIRHTQRIEEQGFTRNYYTKMRKRDATKFHALISATLFRQQGKTIGYQGTIHDITEQMKYTEEIQRRTEQFAALREVGLSMVRELDLKKLLKDIVDHACDLVEGTAGSFNRHNPGENKLEMVVQLDYPSLPEKTSLAPGEGLIGNVWLRKETIRVEDYASWDFREPRWEDHLGHRAAVGVPVIYGENFLGVLELLRESGQPFTEEHAQILELFAHQAAVAIHNAQLFQHAQRRLDRLQALHESDQAIKKR